MERMTGHEIADAVGKLKIEDLRLLLVSVADSLYGEGSPGDWGADTLDDIAGALAARGICPR